MGKSIRKTTTQEERIQMMIDRENNKTPQGKSTTNKLGEYLSQPNVKEFNKIMLNKAFSYHGQRQVFASREEAEKEVAFYFECCDKYNIIPTIAQMVVFLGISRETLYASLDTNIYSYSDILKNAIQICQSYAESSMLGGAIAPLSYIFLSKNYYSMNDSTNINFNATTNDTTPRSQMLDTLKNQLIIDGEYEEKS